MGYRKKCCNCGHRIEIKDGELIHSSPHPHHVCRCEKPEYKLIKNITENYRVHAGISSYSGYVVKEVFGE
jgi:histidinol phosphatase-like enzyme